MKEASEAERKNEHGRLPVPINPTGHRVVGGNGR